MNEQTVVTQNESVFLLDCIEFSARILRGPDAELCQELILQGTRALYASPEASTTGLFPLLAPVREQVEAGERESAWCDELELQYVRLFITAKNGAPAPPYASCHTKGTPRMMGPEAQDMGERLARAGLAVQSQGLEPPDHVSTQLEYLYYLLNAAWVEGYAPPEDGALFARETMLPWVKRFAACVLENDARGFFAALTAFVVQLLEIVATSKT